MKNVKHSFGYWVGGFSDDPDDVARNAQATAYENELFRNAQEILNALKYARRFLKKEEHDTEYIDTLIQGIESSACKKSS